MIRLTSPLLIGHSLVSIRFKIFVLTLLVAVAGLSVWEYFYPSYVTKDWESVTRRIEAKQSEGIQSSFLAYQSDALTATNRVFNTPKLTHELVKGDSASRQVIFESLGATTSADLSVELFDHQKRLVAWSGIRGVAIDTSLFETRPSSVAIQGPVYSYMIVVSPIDAGAAGIWYAVGKRLLDVNFPISNRFISNDAFSTTFTSQLGVDADFDFSSAATRHLDEKTMTVDLKSLSGKTIAFAYLGRPSLAAYQEELTGEIQRVIAALVILLCGAGLWLTLRFADRRGQSLMKLVLLTC